MAKEKLQTLQGMNDFLPQQMIARNWILSTIRRVYESFGFEPVETPCLEYAEVLMGKYGPEADKLIYNFEDRGGRHIGLRYDHTVPLARLIASHPDLPRPFKRYQVGPIWRAERPQKGRYREFTQCDVDIVGASSPAADAEVFAAFYHVYKALGLEDVVIRLNHRRVLMTMARAAGIPEEQSPDAFRSMDKLDKIPREAVLEEMIGAGIDPIAAGRLLDFAGLTLAGAAVEELENRLAGDDEGIAAAREMAEIITLMDAMGVPAANYRLDLSLVRGLDYYTGPIIEAALPELRSSVGGGGRYDNLIGMFGSQALPAVGASVGVDRIVDVLAERGKLPEIRSVVKVLVTVFSPDLRSRSVELAHQLRSTGVNTETYLLDRPLGKQFAYADSKGIPYAIVLGPDEIAQDRVTVRDLRTREQGMMTREEAVTKIGRLVNGSSG